MLSQMGQRVITVVLLIACPSAIALAERPTAMLYANGEVKLNGTPVAKSTSVFDGDRIDTAASSVGSINRNGSSLLVDPNSSVQYKSDGYTLIKGIARMSTSTGAATRVAQVSIIPQGKDAKYDISSNGDVILIASRVGTLTLTDGVDTATLEPGHSARVTTVDVPEYQDQGPKPAAGTRGDQRKHDKKTIFYIFLGSAIAAAAVICAFECGSIGGAGAVSPVVP